MFYVGPCYSLDIIKLVRSLEQLVIAAKIIKKE